MPIHIQQDHVSEGLNFDGSNLSANETLVYAGRYLDNTASSDQTASFIDADTNVNGTWVFSLRDEDHAAGMHYWIRIDVGANSLQIGRLAPSTKTFSGNFAGQTINNVAGFFLFPGDNVLRIRPSGANWVIY